MNLYRTYESIKNTIDKFRHEKSGSIAIIFSVAAIPVFFAVGAAVDYSRYSRAVGNLSSAGDHAIFAASKEMTGSGEDDDAVLQLELEDIFDRYVEANFDKQLHNVEFTRTLVFDRDDRTVSVEVVGAQKTAFLQITNLFGMFGTDELKFKTQLGTRLEVTPENYVMDIVMCIDATGSMQNTLDSVQANASTFDAQLRSELNISASDPRFKVRIRPIYFRDWEDAASGYGWHYTTTPGYGYVHNGYYWVYGYYTVNHLEYGYQPADISRGLKPASDFFDLDVTADAAGFQSFVSSETASGGGNLPEASGACMNEGMRSNWYDRTATTDFPTDENVTVFPIVVVWTDAAIRTLSVTQQLSPTQPTSYGSFETQWENSNFIPQDPKLLILFGPESYSGWSTVKNWDNYEYGGPISTGNSQAIAVIADKIVKTLPDVLRLTN